MIMISLDKPSDDNRIPLPFLSDEEYSQLPFIVVNMGEFVVTLTTVSTIHDVDKFFPYYNKSIIVNNVNRLTMIDKNHNEILAIDEVIDVLIGIFVTIFTTDQVLIFNLFSPSLKPVLQILEPFTLQPTRTKMSKRAYRS